MEVGASELLLMVAMCSRFNILADRGFMWAAKAAKMGYRWKIGNGHKIKFWEDV
jgi:hypothetical protein